MNQSHYNTLGLHPACSENDIKLAYRKLAKEHHPDREGGDAERMAAINQAYEVLSDPERRAHYDATGQSEIQTVIAQARQALISLLSQAFAQINAQPIDTCRSVVKHAVEMQKVERDSAQRRIRQLEKLSGKIHCKAGENLAQGVIDAQLAELRNAVSRMDRQTEISLATLKLLEDYEHEQDADLPDEAARLKPTYFSVGTTSTGGPWL